MSADAIHHVIVLMLENRSFDHFLGACPDRSIDGVNPKAPGRNFLDLGSTVSYVQTPTATVRLKPDPPHSNAQVLRQIDGDGLGAMGGFVREFDRSHPKKARPVLNQVMAYFPWGRDVPALHALADSFCVCDRWFSSVPGPTWTNRFFAHSGTSQGWVEMPDLPIDWNLHKYDQETIYDRLSEAGRTWRIYYGDIPQSLLLENQRSFSHLRNYRRLSNFEGDVAKVAASEDFPDYVFIEPDYFWPGQNDQHPPSSVVKGDALIASVYNAIRGNETMWESTLLIVTWDEHGGFYDHVEPSEWASPPDSCAQEGFGFDRFGVRVPTVLVSKWTNPGPYRPAKGVLDHTSILRYMIDKHGLGELGDRARNAASFAGAISARENTNAPPELPVDKMQVELDADSDGFDSALNRNQAALLDFANSLEPEIGGSEAEVSARALRAAVDIQSQVEVAKERVDLFIQTANVLVGSGRS